MPTNTGGGTTVSLDNTPQAVDDVYGTSFGATEDQIYILNVMANDLGGNAKVLWSIDDTSDDGSGDLVQRNFAGISEYSELGARIWLTADGKIAYDTSTLQGLSQGESKVDQFTYAIRMSNGTLSWATVSITVIGTNDAPVVQAVAAAAIEDGAAVTASFSGDDIDSDDDAASLTYAITSSPAEGSVVNNNDGTFTFNPNAGFQDLAEGETRQVTFTYTATDSHGAVSNSGTVTVTVTGTNDEPKVQNVSAAAEEDGAAIIASFNGDDVDSDDDGASLTYAITSSPTEGSVVNNNDGTFSFSPGTDFQDLPEGETRQVTFTYTATDSHGAISNSGTVTVTVTGTNDVPVASAAANAVAEDASITGSVTATDSDFGETATLTYALVGAPPAGLTFGTDGSYSFSAASYDSLVAGEQLILTIPFTASDATTTSDPANLVITITGTNDVPVANAAVNAVAEDASVSGNVSATDADAGQTATLIYALVDPAPVGLTFNPDGSYSFSAASYDYLVADQQLVLTIPFTASDATSTSAPANLVITVTGTNDVPVANAAVNAVAEDASISGNVGATDADAGETATLTYALVSPAPMGLTFNSNGSYSFDASSYDYLVAGEPLVLTIPFTASDATSTSAAANLVITITGTNDLPVANAAVRSVLEDASISGNVSATDADFGETATLAYALVNPAPVGLTFNPDGSYSFDASSYDYLVAGEPLILTIPFTATDAQAATSAPANLVITITGTNDVPVANAAVRSLLEDASISGNVTALDADFGETATLVYALTDAAPTGLTFNSDGSYSFDASSYDYLTAGEPLVLTIPFTASDASSTSAPANLVITLTGTNDVPVANAAVRAVAEDASISGNVSATDADVGETATLTYALVNPAPAGLTFNPDGSYTFDASSYDYLVAGEPLVLTIPFTATDVQSATSAPANLVITITGTNDIPVANAAVRAVNEDASISGSVSASDADTGQTAALTYALVNPAPTGLTFNANGSYSFDASSYDYLDGGEPLVLTIAFTASDATSTSAPANLVITITGINDSPVLTGTTAILASGTEDTAYTINESDLLAGYTDVDGNEMRVSSLTAFNGILTDNFDGTWTFAPTHNFNGTVALNYTIVDGAGGSVSASNSFTLAPVNDPAHFVGDEIGEVTEDDPVTLASGQLYAVDPDAGQSSFQPQSNVAGLYGTFGITASGAWSYTLNNSDPDTNALAAGQVETETFTVASLDGTTAVVTVTVNGANDAPVANDDSNFVIEDGAAATGNVLTAGAHNGAPDLAARADAADGDVDGDTLTVSNAGTLLGTYGKLELGADGSYTYTLYTETENAAAYALVQGRNASDAPLTDSFNYTVSDGNGGTDTGALNVAVFGVDEPAPAFAANDDVIYISSGTNGATFALSALLGNDVAAGGLIFTITGGAATYDATTQMITLTNSSAGTFSYQLSDGTSTDSATVTVNVLNTTGSGDNINLSAQTYAASYIDLGNGIDSFVGSTVIGSVSQDTIFGGAAVDTLSGNEGNDTLNGNAANDILNGGEGADKFVFTQALGTTGIDTIQDFNATGSATSGDGIVLDDGIFTGFAGQTTLTAAQFNINTAVGTGAQIIFNTATGALIYDSNGTGGGGQTQFATLTLLGMTGSLDASDFIVI